jgi:UPF0716 protein FxsA
MFTFVVFPPLEIGLLLWLGSTVGPTTSFLVILVSGIFGAWMAKRQGLAVLRQLRDDMQQGLPSGSHVMEGAMVLAGGLLLVTPGILTDFFGFSLIVPWTRRLIAPRALKFLMDRFGDSIVIGPGQPIRRPGEDGTRPKPFANPFDDLP